MILFPTAPWQTHRASCDSQPHKPWCCSFSNNFCCYLSFLSRLATDSSHSKTDVVWAGAQCCAGITAFVPPQTAQHRFVSHRGQNSAVHALSSSAKERIRVGDNLYEHYITCSIISARISGLERDKWAAGIRLLRHVCKKMQEPKNQTINMGTMPPTQFCSLPAQSLSLKSGAVAADGEEKGGQISLCLQGISPAGAGEGWSKEGNLLYL